MSSSPDEPAEDPKFRKIAGILADLCTEDQDRNYVLIADRDECLIDRLDEVDVVVSDASGLCLDTCGEGIAPTPAGRHNLTTIKAAMASMPVVLLCKDLGCTSCARAQLLRSVQSSHPRDQRKSFDVFRLNSDDEGFGDELTKILQKDMFKRNARGLWKTVGGPEDLVRAIRKLTESHGGACREVFHSPQYGDAYQGQETLAKLDYRALVARQIISLVTEQGENTQLANQLSAEDKVFLSDDERDALRATTAGRLLRTQEAAFVNGFWAWWIGRGKRLQIEVDEGHVGVDRLRNLIPALIGTELIHKRPKAKTYTNEKKKTRPAEDDLIGDDASVEVDTLYLERDDGEDTDPKTLKISSELIDELTLYDRIFQEGR